MAGRQRHGSVLLFGLVQRASEDVRLERVRRIEVSEQGRILRIEVPVARRRIQLEVVLARGAVVRARRSALNKVFHFDSPRERYECDAAVVWCFDNRFDVGFRKFLKRAGVTYADPIKVAGGAKCLASPDELADREFVLKQIRISMELHKTKRVILMLHSDCGAYGGLDGGFQGDARLEAASQRSELIRAVEVLRSILPELQVEAYFVDFEGVWQVAERGGAHGITAVADSAFAPRDPAAPRR